MKNLLATLFWLSSLACYAQWTPEEIAIQVEDYHERNPQEKIYLDFDKPAYTSGDDMWFKSYLVAGFFNQLSPLSKIIYVELLDPNGAVVERIQMESDFGIGAGHFRLDRNLISGRYLIRAYTQWMRNFDPAFFFRKEIDILSIFGTSDSLRQEKAVKAQDIHFFPEGGNLVDGLRSQVAFKAVDESGLGINVKGWILSDRQDTLGKFSSEWNGMGSFTITPAAGRTYYAVVEGVDDKFTLPSAYSKGQVINLLNIPGLKEVRFQVFNNDPRLKEVILFIHNRGLPLVASLAKLNSQGVVTGAIPKSIFEPGINHFTVFDKDGNPLVERLFYYDTIPAIGLKVASERTVYGKREKVTCTVSAPLLSTVADTAYLSVAVTSDQEVNIDPGEANIISSLLLTSELKGYIEDPGAYFDTSDPSLWKKRNLLMMTHGWRRFRWEDIFGNSLETTFPIEQGLSIKGQLVRDYTSKPAPEGSVAYNVMDSVPNFGKVQADKEGNFVINDLFLTGKKAIILSGTDKKGKENVIVEVDSARYNSPATEKPVTVLAGPLEEWQANMVKKGFLRENIDAAFDTDDAIILDEVEVKSRRLDDEEEELNDKAGNIYGRGDFTLKAKDIGNASSFIHPLELVRARVPGVRVIGGINNWAVQVGGVASINSGGAPLILVDNVQVPLEYLNTIPASNIEFVEVYKGPSAAIFGAQGANGALAFFTKTGYQPVDVYRTPNTTILYQKGYQEYMEFYSPDYSVTLQKHAKPDKRATLFWDPLLQTNANGEAEFSFYTSDEAGTFTITIEGLSRRGLMDYRQHSFEVK